MKSVSPVISVITDCFVFKEGHSFFLYPRGSNVILLSIISEIKKIAKFNFEVFQMGEDNLDFNFSNITIHIIRSHSFSDFNQNLLKYKIKGIIVHYNNVDIFEKVFPNTTTTATIHTNTFMEKPSSKKWLSRIIQYFDKVVVVNNKYTEMFNHVKYIPNGISKEVFSYNNTKKLDVNKPINILFPNLNTPKKNRGFAIKLIKELNKDSPYKFKLILTGTTERLPLNKNIYEYVGRKKCGSEMNKLYKRAFVTIIPSFSESCSLCVLESMSSGTVVVANDIFGIRSYIKDNDTGYLISVSKFEEWVKRINFLVDNKKEYDRIRKNARNSIVKEYNSKQMGYAYYNMWLKLINNH